MGLLRDEMTTREPDSGAVAARLADILFLQTVRLYLRSDHAKAAGWIRGMSNPQIGRALASMHAQPAQPWTVETLAQSVGMSRARFAARFRELVGRGLLDYLTQWRMYEAARHLGRAETSLECLASRSGYRSAMAFSKASKRCAGCSPAEFRRRVLSGEGDASQVSEPDRTLAS